VNNYLLLVDRISAWSGKAFAWTVLILTLTVCYDVGLRYMFNSPTQWGFDIAYILFGTLFMMAGAYTLSRNGHVRADMMYRTMSPRTQAWFDIVLYLLFFVPGVAALAYAGIEFTQVSWAMKEVSSVTSSGVPIYPFKLVIPVAGFLLLLQGFAEIARCVVCIRTGAWPQRLHDVEEEDIDQLKDLISGDKAKGA
jgi:TRAP-type mannitol/chloroaromatic compound transport system permease small subunit